MINKSRDKKVLMWVYPTFKSTIKINAAKKGESIINYTRKLVIDKDGLFEEEHNEEKRY